MSEQLEHRLTKLEQAQTSQGERMGVIENELKDIVKLLSTRPTWLITGFITILTGVSTGLIVYVASH